MKRSRIFLGASTLLLAVGAAFASKAAKFNSVAFYYSAGAGSGAGICYSVATICNNTPAHLTCKTSVSGFGTKTLYTAVDANSPAPKNQPGSICSGNKFRTSVL